MSIVVRFTPVNLTAEKYDEALSPPLPHLLDAKALRLELGITRAAAETIIRQLPVVQFAALRKTYVRRDDVEWLITERTFSEVPR